MRKESGCGVSAASDRVVHRVLHHVCAYATRHPLVHANHPSKSPRNEAVESLPIIIITKLRGGALWCDACKKFGLFVFIWKPDVAASTRSVGWGNVDVSKACLETRCGSLEKAYCLLVVTVQ